MIQLSCRSICCVYTIAASSFYLKLVTVQHCMWSRWVLTNIYHWNLFKKINDTFFLLNMQEEITLCTSENMYILRIISCYNLFSQQFDLSIGFFSAEGSTFSLQPHHLFQHPTGTSKKEKFVTGADHYVLQLKQMVYQLLLLKSLILKAVLEHHCVCFLWWILHTYIYNTDPL